MAAWCIKIQWSTSSRLWDRGHVQGMFFCLCYQHTCSLCFHGRDDSIAVCFYQFAGFDPFERSTYFGPFFDLGQVRKIFSLRSCVDRYIITCIPYASWFSQIWQCSLNAFDEYFTIRLTGSCLVTRKGESWAVCGLKRLVPFKWKLVCPIWFQL